MGAFSADTGTNHLRITTLNLSDSTSKLIAGWFWRSTTHSPASSQNLMYLGNGAANAFISLGYNNTVNWTIGASGTSAGDLGSSTSGQWVHLAVYGGPWAGVAFTRRKWINGVEGATAGSGTTVYAGDLETLTIFANNSNTAIGRGYAAEVLVQDNPADPDAIVQELQTQAVNALSFTPTFAERLYDGAGAFTATNVTFDTGVHPSVSTTSGVSFVPYVVLL